MKNYFRVTYVTDDINERKEAIVGVDSEFDCLEQQEDEIRKYLTAEEHCKIRLAQLWDMGMSVKFLNSDNDYDNWVDVRMQLPPANTEEKFIVTAVTANKTYAYVTSAFYDGKEFYDIRELPNGTRYVFGAPGVDDEVVAWMYKPKPYNINQEKYYFT